MIPYGAAASDFEFTGSIDAEFRYFSQAPLTPGLAETNFAIAAEVEAYRRLGAGDDSLRITPFVRLDQRDSRRSRLDLREFYWQKVGDNYELTVGVSRVFWGVAETRHLVNIINQVDLAANGDEEEFLGQSMVSFNWIQDWGSLTAFILPFFRERPFPGADGRPGAGMRISDDTAIYEAGNGKNNVDFALRWSHSFGAWDVGLAHFHGTSREPRLDPAVTRIASDGTTALIPIYDIIDQSSVDIQATFGAWLWKFEAIRRVGQGDDFTAAVGGFEYTFSDVGELGADIGLIGEYLYDERDFIATDNDISVGLRLSLNDINSTELLAGLVYDLNNGSRYFSVEASRRIGNAWTIYIEARGAQSVDARDPLHPISRDDYIELRISRFF